MNPTVCVSGFMTIGIPTVWRDTANTTYLLGTIASIIEHTTAVEKKSITMLILLADFAQHRRDVLFSNINKTYQEYIDSGFIQIMSVKQSAYPPLTHLKQNYKDAPKRVSWRSKQVVDFAFMFYYARNLSTYYLQIEDDVITAPNFYASIKDFIIKQSKPWVTLQFSELGFIGKLFKSSDLDQFAKFLMLFYQEQPVDFLFILFAKLLTFPTMPLRKPTLFQHMGYYSTLRLSKSQKLNKLKDKYFAAGMTVAVPFPKHSIQEYRPNPPALLYSNITHYKHYLPYNAYSNNKDEYFWGKTPKANDTFLVVFRTALPLNKVSIETGHQLQMNDYLRHGQVDVSPGLDLTSNGGTKCHNYQYLGVFVDGHFEDNNLQSKVSFPIKCLRILVTKSQEEWLIIHKILVQI